MKLRTPKQVGSESLPSKDGTKLRSLLCWLGLHWTKKLTLKGAAWSSDDKSIDLHYHACQYCGEGDPRVTGEW